MIDGLRTALSYSLWINCFFFSYLFQIPFSKFFLSSKGRVQDKQTALPLNRISNFGISVGARVGTEGPFNLEIDYIGLEFDPLHTEEFAYELYKMPKYTVAT